MIKLYLTGYQQEILLDVLVTGAKTHQILQLLQLETRSIYVNNIMIAIMTATLTNNCSQITSIHSIYKQHHDHSNDYQR